MKFTVTFKTPDASTYALESIRDQEEKDAAEKVIEKFVRDNEYTTIVFDTETQTAYVFEVMR